MTRNELSAELELARQGHLHHVAISYFRALSVCCALGISTKRLC
jgi:hypothetical protein